MHRLPRRRIHIMTTTIVSIGILLLHILISTNNIIYAQASQSTTAITTNNGIITLDGSITLANPSTEKVGQSGFIVFIQDGTGSRTCTLGTDYESAASAGITLTTTANATDIVPYVVAAANRILLGTPQLAFA